MNHRDEVHGQLLEPGAQATALLEPAHNLFDQAPAPVELTIEAMPPVLGMLIPAARDHRLDRMIPQPVTDRLEAVALVSRHRLRAHAAPDPDPVHHRCELRALVDLACRDWDGEGKPAAVSDQVEFAPESAVRATQRVVGGFLS